MKFEACAIPDVVRVVPEVYGDSRGRFFETWNARRFREAGIEAKFVQDNHSYSAGNILRGLHYQIRNPQGKLVRVVSGEVFDVAVDLRRDSPTFGRWVGELLNPDNRHMLWIPPGFAHGFYVTDDHADFLYKCTDFYAPEHERTIRWDDPDLAIAWPLASGSPPLLSARDRAGVAFGEAEVYP